MASKQTKNGDASFKGRTMKAQGPDKSSGVGKGGRSTQDLPADLKAMRSNEERLPKEATSISSGAETAPAVDSKLIKSVESWDLKRDRALEKGSKS